MRSCLLALCLLLVLAACNKPSPPVFKTIKSIEATEMTAQNVTVKGVAVYHNPNPMKGTLTAAHISVWVNDVKVGNIDQDLHTPIPANSDFDFPFQLSFPPSKVFNQKGWLSSLASMIENKNLDIRYKGTMSLEIMNIEFDIPVDYEEKVDLSK